MPVQSDFTVADSPELRRKFRRIIAFYKANFAQIDAGERYKWRAIRRFQTIWDIDAPDFAAMLSQAFSRTKNLLSSSNYYPLRAIKQYAQAAPESARASFRALLDESQPFQQRYDCFHAELASFSQSVEDPYGNQDLRAVMVYLTFAYPEKYYLYKYIMHSGFCKYLGLANCVPPSTAPEALRLDAFNRLSELLHSEIVRDPELLRMSRERLGEDCYRDEAYHILTMDLMFYASNLRIPLSELPEAREDAARAGTDVLLNTVLYGPPGTGKTYALPLFAVSILEDIPLSEVEGWRHEDVLARYAEYRAQERVAFTTFHQSYGYEEFIEGIRPVLAENPDDAERLDGERRSELLYSLEPGIFKRFCRQAEMRDSVRMDAAALGISANPSVWKVSLQGTGDNPTRRECLAHGHIRIGWDEYGPEITEETDFRSGGKIPLNAFLNRMQIGDIVLSCYSASEIDAIGVVTGEPEWREEYPNYRRLRKVRWLDRRIVNIQRLNGGKRMTLSTVYQLGIAPAAVLRLLESHHPEWASLPVERKNYVFIIDEINRGNISNIFGELITLIEPAKRAGGPEATSAVLPYSGDSFDVPGNVYLLGTMNTADRSVTAIDSALRRRFDFRELPPRPELLDGVEVQGLDVGRMLEIMNRRIAALYDREHTIGHSYLLPLRESPDLATLAGIFRNRILPLLQEYFYDNYEKIRLVLGDNRKQGSDCPQFVEAIPCDPEELFGDADVRCAEFRYEIHPSAFDRIEAYRYLR